MSNDFHSLFSSVKKDIVAYVNLRLRLLQLDIYEKSGRSISFLLYGLIFLLILFFAVLFVFLTFGFYIGNLLGNFALGMLSVAALYVICLLLMLFFRKRIQIWILNLFLSEITTNDDEYQDEETI